MHEANQGCSTDRVLAAAHAESCGRAFKQALTTWKRGSREPGKIRKKRAHVLASARFLASPRRVCLRCRPKQRVLIFYYEQQGRPRRRRCYYPVPSGLAVCE